jgi:quercetin dioxygenase-like cupin family protein
MMCNQKGEREMLKVDLDAVPPVRAEGGLTVSFPFHSAMGTASTAAVWITLEPGAELAEHCDSAEELLYAVAGVIEANVGDESDELRAGEVALVPAMAPHSLRNTGEVTARVLGFFSSSTNIATFAEPMGPGGPRVVAIGAPVPLAAALEQAASLA